MVSLRSELLCIEERPLVSTPALASFPHRCVVLDQGQLEAISARYGFSAVVGIVAHEFGHVVAYQRSGDLSQPSADYWAGCALARRGYWPDAYVAYLSDEEGYDAARDEATRRGWAECRKKWKTRPLSLP